MRVHAFAWLVLGVLVFFQGPGQVAADTKHDLTANPAQFLAGATHAWTDTFTLGQLQNQAYGYLFPQGLFFLITDPLPDWVAQRLWWWLVLGVGFSGMLLLTQKLNIGSPAFRILAAALFALSPRTLTTLTAISSETWPVMLAPWVCLPLLGTKVTARSLALSLLPAAAMGAVNATATLAALVPAGLILLYRVLQSRAWWQVPVWGLGLLLVSAWWIGPLLILGRYAPPFTEFIESAAVTTNWLNLTEILRGTTSWTPFVDTERQAGYLLVSEPLFVMLTVLVAAAGLAGLALMKRRGLWVFMLVVGMLILGAATIPLVRDFLDGAGAPLRNIHKFDPLVRMPLMVGVAALGGQLSVPRSLNLRRGHAVALLVMLIGIGATAPAWSGRLLPQGTWDEVPSYWAEATDYINEHAANTRTLIVPGSPFARQEWGWTRDEPAQPLLDVPWAVRDAIPLVPPEAIRGLDGLEAVLSELPEEAALARLGIGAVIVRHDLEADRDVPDIEFGEKTTFGEVDVHLVNPDQDMMIADSTDLPTVAGGGEILSLLDALEGYSPRHLTASDAEVVTDTPMLVGTNYGDGSSSAVLASEDETEVRNRLIDYTSAGPLTRVVTEGSLEVSSSASDATSFGGSNPSRSPNALVDARDDTAWYPTPGDSEPWLEVSGTGTTLSITATDDVTATVNSGGAVTVRDLEEDEPQTFTLAEPSARIELSGYAGLTELSMDGLSRAITVPDTSPDVRQFVFQRMTVPTEYLDRTFTAPRDMTVTVDAQSCEDIELNGEPIQCGEIDLPAGQHTLRSDALWLTLTESTRSIPVTPAESLIDATSADRLLITTRSFSPGMEAAIGGQPLEAVELDASSQGFIIPAGTAGELTMTFAGDRPYRAALIVGGVVSLITVLVAGLMGLRGRRQALQPDQWEDAGNASWAGLLLVPVLGWWFVPAAAAVWAVLRFTLIPRWLLAVAPVSVAGLWLAQAPWPAAGYPASSLAGSTAMLVLAGISVLATLVPIRSTKE